MTAPIKVAILGGGCGALSAAFWLTATPQLRAQYKVTVYSQGWRLGGKGASGRGATHARIEEHGLHMMMGFYETVFRTIGRCYAQMPHQADDAFTTWQQAFDPQRSVSIWLRLPVGAPTGWEPRTFDFPVYPGTPGDEPLQLPPAADYMDDAVDRLLDMLTDDVFAQLQLVQPALVAAASQLKALLDAARLLRPFASAQSVVTLLRDAQRLFKLLAAPVLKACFNMAPPTGIAFDCYVSYLFFDLGLAGLIGFLSDVVPRGEAGYDAINAVDFKDWLVSHGADPVSAESPVIMCVYDLAFAYRDGDSSTPAKGQAAAGAMLRLFIRMAFTYKDAPLWKMNGGMGDIIFTPLYRTLESRGVGFEFFHRATALHVTANRITSIDFVRQAKLVNATYHPLVRTTFQGAKAWDCWPSQPLWGQLVNGAALAQQGVDFEDPWTQHSEGSRTLTDGQDFDLVVLGIPPAASRHLTQEISVASMQWQAMLDNTHSVATRSVQMWLKPNAAGLGCAGRMIATGYQDPLRTWAEMSHLLPFEAWPAGAQPGSCEYLCGTMQQLAGAPLPGANKPGFLVATNLQVKQHASAWFGAYTGVLWPGVALAGGSLDLSQVVADYSRANLAYSELYVQTLPATVVYRLDPGWRGMANLFLAGDWTRTSINGGCAEAAFESGLHAASAVTGQPPPP